jgi:hypothetical protein
MEDPKSKAFSALQVELLNGTPDDTRAFTGLSTQTTVRSLRAVVAARVGRAPKDVRLMAFGHILDDCKH